LHKAKFQKLLEEFREFIKVHSLFNRNDRLLIAVSGGADSVALCELCRQAEYNFEMAHCNFQLRGDESNRDENFVQKIADDLGVKLHSIRFETEKYAKENKVSIEVAARNLRYGWFEKLIREMKVDGSSFLLTAHHQNDNIETLLMNFFRGTGVRGLKGIPVKKGYIRRPLLFASKPQILDFLNQNHLPHVEDSTNWQDDYTRNFVRNTLLPEIEKVFPKVRENLAANIERFQDVELLYMEALEKRLKKLVVVKNNETLIPILKLTRSGAVKTILFEIVKDYGFLPSQISEILNLTRSLTGSYISSHTHRIIRNREWLIITPLPAEFSQHILVEENTSQIVFSGGTLHIEKKQWTPDSVISTDTNIASVDAKEISFPLLLRKWGTGDYFYPLGMQKKKKLSRFLIDKKLSLPEKENVWVIEQKKKIVWVVGHRIDDRFKITPTTKEVFVFKLKE